MGQVGAAEWATDSTIVLTSADEGYELILPPLREF